MHYNAPTSHLTDRREDRRRIIMQREQKLGRPPPFQLNFFFDPLNYGRRTFVPCPIWVRWRESIFLRLGARMETSYSVFDMVSGITVIRSIRVNCPPCAGVVGARGHRPDISEIIVGQSVSKLIWTVIPVALVLQMHKKADSTRRCSRAVPHPSTNRALRRLTSEVGRDPVHSTRYGRRRTR